MATSSFRLKHESCDDSASLGAMGSLIRKLDELLQTEDGKKSIIQKFRDDVVGNIYTRLENLLEVQDPPQTVNCWMKDVRELSYDMADFFNGLVHAHDAEVKVDEISEFEELVNDAIEQYDCYNLEKYLHQDSQIPVRPGLGWAYAETEHVGMDNRIKELTSLVVHKGDDKGDWQLKIVSILGADQGVGKSTLAQKLWCASEIEFGTCRAFVLMAKKSDIRMTLRSILSQIRPHEAPCDYNVPYLIHDIKTHLQDKRYFIVIDDLWAISVWDIIRRAFPDSKNCSRILITTKVEDIAHACCSNRNNIFDIKPLSDKQTNELFLSRVFGPGKECPQELNVDSDEISRKCGGLPLAIICIATLVASQQEINQILDTETMKRQLDFVKKFLDNNLGTRPTSVEILNQVLKLCYSSLPHYLKTCLLYLSMYPENYLIMKEDLVKQWIAEGFIVEGKSIAKNASSYFDVLVSFGLIQQMDIDINKKQHRQEKGQEGKEGHVVEVEQEEKEEEHLMYSNRLSYVVHPTVYEFIIRKCSEDNFLTTIDYSQSKVVLTERIHRLSLQFGSATYATTPTSIRLSQVRSLAFMGLWNCMPSLLEFKAVRVMILHIQSDERDKRVSLAEIDKLLLLRYLQVRCNVTVQLPVQVQCLKQLETLEINAGIEDVPTDIVLHSGLQHVRIGRKTKHKNLAKGPAISTDPIFPKYLSSKPFSAVQVLELLPPICSFSRLPGWIGQLSSLRILEVVVRELRKYDLDHLGKLPVLTVLSLYVQKPDRDVVTFHKDASFPALECLNLIGVSLSFPEKAMPKLWKLKIGFNARRGEKYRDMLHGIQHLPKLKEVVARIGVDTDAQESDMVTAESEYKNAISKHPSGLSANVKVDKVDGKHDLPECSNKQDRDVLNLNEIQIVESTKQAGIPERLPRQQSGSDAILQTGLDKDLVPTTPPQRQSQNEVWRRPGPYIYTPQIEKGMLAVLGRLEALLKEAHAVPFNNDGDGDNIPFLCRELRFRLHDIPNELIDRPRREWLQSYCDLAYDIEDWADNLALIRSSPSSMASWWSPPVDLMVCVRELQEQLIDKDIHDVPRRLPLEPQDILLHNQPSSLVGHKRRMEEVIDMLMNSKDMAKLKIISIVGMVGSGKTTLAASVYQRVNEHFDCCAFVYMGQQCDTVETLKGMLRQLEMKDQESMDIFDLKWMLREFLRDKRYLIMFDDLWSRQHWDIIQSCFPQNGPDSKIIITTTDDAVALHCSLGLSDWIYKIDLLSDVDSEQLFLNQVCRTGKGFPQHFKDHSTEIMKKCGGLPLAIVSAAAMLEHNQSEDEWRRIGLKSLLTSDKNYMWQRLNLIYNNLPHILKTCMLYLSTFPVYYEVDVERLVKLWLAEGFTFKTRYRPLEETARSCLDGLISRNMVLPLHVNHHGIPKRCMVHPVIHDFIVYKSREENFVAIVNDQHQDKTNTYGTIRRLSLQSSSKKDRTVPQDTSMDLSRVRSIIVIGQACTVPDLAGLRLVRVLDLEGCDVMTLCLDDLHKLQLLRYLSLRGTNVNVLPDTIGELRYLQTLDVRSTNVKELPLSIFRLQELMHLLCGSAKLPPIIKRMEMLQTLSYATHSSTILWDLRKFVNLRQLQLFLDFTQMPHDGKQVTLNHGGFRSLKKLCIRCNSTSVAFEPGVLTGVEVLELSFQEPLVNEASAVSGIEHLRSLKHVLLEFSQGDARAVVTVDAVKEATTKLQRWNPKVTVTVDWRPLGSTST